MITPQTMYAIGNSADIDFDKITLADAIGYIEFEEDINSWEDEVED